MASHLLDLSHKELSLLLLTIIKKYFKQDIKMYCKRHYVLVVVHIHLVDLLIFFLHLLHGFQTMIPLEVIQLHYAISI
jgi:hypothetical protein